MQTNIEKNVMRRVHAIHALRPIVSMGALSIVIATVALWGIGREVWVARVFQNTPHSGGLVSVAHFYIDAFDHTRLIVQALTLLTAASLVYLARETAQLTKNLVAPLVA